VFASSIDGTSGPSFAAVFDLADWDASMAINAPGQSGAAASPHFGDLAKPWAAGEYFALPFTDAAVRAAAESILTLMPAR
jgi:penicillin amidase